MVDEDQFRGHAAGTVSVRWGVPPYPDRPDFNPGGLAVLWAEENSRDALFAAMRRREAYGTSGPRIAVRFFGGWGYPEDLCGERRRSPRRVTRAACRWAASCRRSRTAERGRAPRFAVWALRDPGAPARRARRSQRIQIVKGWVAGGESRERVYDVAGDPASGADVDLATCTPRAGRRSALPRLDAIPTSTRPRPRSTTRAWSRTRAAAGTPARVNAHARRLRQPGRRPARARRVLRRRRARSRSRSARGRRRSGTHRRRARRQRRRTPRWRCSTSSAAASPTIEVGQPRPTSSCPTRTASASGSPTSAASSAVVLYFYPKDDTPGCTAEACSFRDSYEDFQDAGAEVIGVSSDSAASHAKFAKRHQLPFTLLSDAKRRGAQEVRRARHDRPLARDASRS